MLPNVSGVVYRGCKMQHDDALKKYPVGRPVQARGNVALSGVVFNVDLLHRHSFFKQYADLPVVAVS